MMIKMIAEDYHNFVFSKKKSFLSRKKIFLRNKSVLTACETGFL